MGFTFYKQFDSYDCGPTCLKMVAEHYGKQFSLEYLREQCYITRSGVSLLGVSQAAESIGFSTLMVKIDLQSLKEDCLLPAILHWNQDHFVLLTSIQSKRELFGKGKTYRYKVADPAHGVNTISEEAFTKSWLHNQAEKGVALLIEPTQAFYENKNQHITEKSFSFLLGYLRPFKKTLSKLALFMLLSTAITISFPFLTKGIIDEGVLAKNYSVMLLFAISQIGLFISDTILSLVRSRLLFHMNAKISLKIVSDFLTKLVNLPIRFFDSKSVGDISQRINDHHRIERFLTGDFVNTVFSLVYILVFTTILAFFNLTLFLIFISMSSLGILWIFLFQKKRQQLDYVQFAQSKDTQEKLFEIVVGMQELKLFGSENSKRWEWENLQRRSYRLSLKSLSLEQYQNTGFSFLNQLKNILITFFASLFVMQGQMSFGTMLSISFILGQTNGPLDQLIRFFKSAQDANLSVNRLKEVLQKENEEQTTTSSSIGQQQDYMRGSIILKNVSFQYQGPRSPFVLKDINLKIPAGKVTAIVGNSGSGKTTLMKLLLGFYSPVQGEILIKNKPLSSFSPKIWRKQCGSVMQDGYIFNDSIKRNIVLDGNDIDAARLRMAADISNIDEFISTLPLGYNTKIGNSGMGLSGGQKQRILIARSVYKNPTFLFFDEATSSLDANNEQLIMDNLAEFFEGRTVIIIAHRLSTVKNADQIIVLDKGEIIETGTHETLTQAKGKYFELVKNQLELGE